MLLRFAQTCAEFADAHVLEASFYKSLVRDFPHSSACWLASAERALSRLAYAGQARAAVGGLHVRGASRSPHRAARSPAARPHPPPHARACNERGSAVITLSPRAQAMRVQAEEGALAFFEQAAEDERLSGHTALWEAYGQHVRGYRLRQHANGDPAKRVSRPPAPRMRTAHRASHALPMR